MSAAASTSSQNNSKITFKCERHSSIIFEKLQYFYGENKLCDTVLRAGMETIHAHRIVLCAFSEYFWEKLCNSHTNLCELNMEATTLKPIIDFLYSGSIEMSMETVEGILRAACFLKIKILIDGCWDFIEKNINASNASTWIHLAKEFKITRRRAKAIQFSLEETLKDIQFLKLDVNELEDLLFKNNPHGDFEEKVFLSVVKWMNYNKPNRENLLLKLLSKVRFQNLSPMFIVENIEMVCKTAESYKLICSWLKWHLSPDKLAVIQISDANEIRMQIYNPVANSWSVEKQTTLMKNKKCFSTIVIEDKLFVVGGKINEDNCRTNSVECLELETFEWSDSLPPMKHSRCSCQLANLKGDLCVFDGFDKFNKHFEASIEIYNFSTCQWREVKPPKQISKMSQITAHDGILYILDFYNSFLQLYDVSINKWTLKKIEKDFYQDFGFAAVDEFLYVFGGYYQKNVKCYNLSTESWNELAPLPRCYSYIKSTIFENKIVICAVDSNDHIVAVEEYNRETNSWNALKPFPMESTFKATLIFILSGTINLKKS